MNKTKEFTITPLSDRPMTEKEDKALELLICDNKRKVNAEILKNGKMGFIK